MLSFTRHRQRVVLPAHARRPALLHGLHGHRQQPQPGAPERAAADHGLAALLGRSSATSTASASTSPRRSRASSTRSTGSRPSSTSSTRTRCSSQVKLIAEPWDVGAGRLPGRQLPGALDRVERHLPRRRCATSGAARRASATSPTASPARPTSTSRTAAGRSRRSTSSPRTTASRSPTSSRYNDKHNEANLRGQPRRHRRQPQLELRRRGADRRPGDQRAARAPAAQLPRDAVPLAGRADAARRRRARPHAARQQQRLLPGQRDLAGSTGTLDERQRAAARVHAAADRAAARRTRCSGAPTFLAGERDAARACPTSWWFRPDGRKMTRRDWERRRRAALGVFLNGDELARRATRSGEPVVDDSFLMLFNAAPRDARRSRCPPRRFGPRWAARALDRRPGRRAVRRIGRARGVDRRVALAASCSARVERPRLTLARDLPAAARARPRLRATRASSCRTCASSASATSTSRRCCRRARLDARLRRRRPARGLRRARRRARRCARSGEARASASSLDIVPNHMAADEENPFWRDPELRERFFDLDPATGRHRRFFDIDELAGVRVEDPEVFETTHRLVLELVARGARRRPARSTTPTGSPTRAGYLERLRDRRRRARLGREDPRARRAAARLAGRGDDGLRVPERRCRRCSSTRPARRSLDRARRRARGRSRGRARGEARAGARRRSQPEVERLRRLLDVPDLERALASLPVYRTYVEPWSGRVDGRRPRRRWPALPDAAAPRAAARGARPRRVRHPLPADDRRR